MLWLAPALLFLFILELLFYFWRTPTPIDRPVRPFAIESRLGSLLFAFALFLSLLRLPFALFPYLTKLLYVLLVRPYRIMPASSHYLDAIRTLGDFFNFGLTILLFRQANLSETAEPLVVFAVAAEGIRLFAEKGQLLFSATWQLLPHRRLAQWFIPHASRHSWLARYCAYYRLGDRERLQYIGQVIQNRARLNPAVRTKLAYFTAFRVMPDSYYLRAGAVRDVARGEVFIHRRWLNDPWLLIGLAMRRAPWIYDPRFLARPFYYRTGSNRLVTLFVLQNPRFSLPFTFYQFGHEIKAARYDLFFRLARWLGFELETRVSADGTYSFDPLLGWLQQRRREQPAQRPLCTDEELLKEVTAELRQGKQVTPLAVATRYTYPLLYVNQVLWPLLLTHQNHPYRYPLPFLNPPMHAPRSSPFALTARAFPTLESCHRPRRKRASSHPAGRPAH